jgi:hypothetical protein
VANEDSGYLTPVFTYHRYASAYKGYRPNFTVTKYATKNSYLPPLVKDIDNVFWPDMA